ncbi:MAG TPA: MBL fold metallo-hydrolase [Steroidobacteraceae bacterium]|nr:MBL fold metallo-hydrolase [Steroidobacteraceae bacterium]
MDSPAPPARRVPKIRWGLRETLRSLGGGPGYDGPPSDHFDGHVFFNPGSRGNRSFGDFLKWQRTREPKVWPRWVLNRARPELPPAVVPGQIALTFINHITFLVQFAGLNILTDPVYSWRVSPFRSLGPQRVRDPGLAFEDLPPIHLVLVSHNHYDHLDLPTLMKLEAVHAPHFITGLGNRPFLQQFGLRSVDELDWWESRSVAAANITMTPARHWSSRRPRNRNRTLWGGFCVHSGGCQLYFAGDTGYGPHFREVRERFGQVNLALLPIGAYEPRWFMSNQHMDPDEAVRAHLDLGAKVSVGSHFGCFQLTDEGIDDPIVELAAARQRHAVSEEDFPVLNTGETRLFRR